MVVGAFKPGKHKRDVPEVQNCGATFTHEGCIRSLFTGEEAHKLLPHAALHSYSSEHHKGEINFGNTRPGVLQKPAALACLTCCLVGDLSQAREAAGQLGQSPVGQQLVNSRGFPARRGSHRQGGGDWDGADDRARACGDGTQVLDRCGCLHS